jgi:hypothetical protein
MAGFERIRPFFIENWHFKFIVNMQKRQYFAIISLALLIFASLIYLFLQPSSKIEQEKPLQGSPKNDTSNALAKSSSQVSFQPAEVIQKSSEPIQTLPSSTPSPSEKDQIINKVRDASTTYDAASLPIIEPYLYSPDPEVRGEAVNAIVNLGDKAGAALLRKYAEKESNLERKLEILKLADWLELPSGKIRFSKKKSEKAQP